MTPPVNPPLDQVYTQLAALLAAGTAALKTWVQHPATPPTKPPVVLSNCAKALSLTKNVLTVGKDTTTTLVSSLWGTLKFVANNKIASAGLAVSGTGTYQYIKTGDIDQAIKQTVNTIVPPIKNVAVPVFKAIGREVEPHAKDLAYGAAIVGKNILRAGAEVVADVVIAKKEVVAEGEKAASGLEQAASALYSIWPEKPKDAVDPAAAAYKTISGKVEEIVTKMESINFEFPTQAALIGASLVGVAGIAYAAYRHQDKVRSGLESTAQFCKAGYEGTVHVGKVGIEGTVHYCKKGYQLSTEACHYVAHKLFNKEASQTELALAE